MIRSLLVSSVLALASASVADIGDQFPPLELSAITAEGWRFVADHGDGRFDVVGGDWSHDGWDAFLTISANPVDPVIQGVDLLEIRERCFRQSLSDCLVEAEQAGDGSIQFHWSALTLRADGPWDCSSMCE